MLCNQCKKNIPLKEYWGMCLECWDRSCKEVDEENMVMWKEEAKKKRIPVKEYIEEYVKKAILN